MAQKSELQYLMRDIKRELAGEHAAFVLSRLGAIIDTICEERYDEIIVRAPEALDVGDALKSLARALDSRLE